MDAYCRAVPITKQIEALASFAERTRRGEFSKCAGVRVQTVQVALRSVGTTFELDGLPNPCYKIGFKEYHKRLQQMLEGYKREDPPPSHKLAVPVTVIHEILHATAENFTPRRGVIANLCTIAFYFLLRSVEYSDTGKENTRTHGFTLGDITFWHNDIRIPITAHPSLLFTADAATLRIRNQKNGFAGETIHQEATYKLDCPVAALARTANYIIQNNKT